MSSTPTFLRSPDAVTHADGRAAVTIADEALRREELFAAAGAVATRISGAPAVAVHATASIETVVGVVGCLLAGVPFVPVPPDSGPSERDHILRDSRASCYLGDIPETPVALDHIKIDVTERTDRRWPDRTSSDTAMIMYTSGTTGKPKGVVMSLAALASGLDGLAAAWDWTGEDTVVHGLPLFHAHGLVLGVLGSLRVGGAFVHVGRPTPTNYATAARQHASTVLFGVPTIWSRIAADPDSARELRRSRLLVSGSAPLPVSVFTAVQSLAGQAPVERYGMTETLITLATRADGDRRAGWVGEPIRGVRTRLVDADRTAVSADGEAAGELQVQGPNLFDGYLGQPEKTAQCWTDDGWFRTQDIAVVDAQGYHRIVGRESVDVIKTGGFKVGAGEVEAALLDHPDVSDAAVVGVDDPDLGQRIVAYVVGDINDTDALIDFVSQHLSRHKRPREVRLVDNLPRNAMGKVQKSLLAQ
jgi:fatty acid CoA ligase FadD36